MVNLNNTDYIDYVAKKLDSILEWNDEAAKRISGIYYDKKLMDRKMKIKRIKSKINEHLVN